MPTQLCVIVILFNVPVLVLLQKNSGTTESFSHEKPTEKCSFWEKFLNYCQNKANEFTTPDPDTRNPVYVSDDSAAKNLGFSFSAFVITLFASLAIALTGAFTCWCCRTFCRQGSFTSTGSRIVTPPPSIYNNSGLALEPLVNDPRQNYRRSDSLPSYANAASAVPTAPPLEDPPPTYASLFGETDHANKS